MEEPKYFKSVKQSVWRSKFKSLEEYYNLGGNIDIDTGRIQYDPQYYYFDKYEIQIDPDEPLENLEKYDPIRRKKELIKCADSFSYFCHKYVKILHPMRGLIPFVLFKYQRKTISDYENYRFNIISKFRQGGLTTVTLLWGLWRCMFQLDQQIMLLSKTDREATDIGMMIDKSCENMPEWLKPRKDAKWNDHLKMFTDTGSALKFYSPEAARGKSVTFLIVDECAFIDDMERHWKAMWPILSTGGSCTLISTVNGLGNWYEQTYHEAKEKLNKFHIIDLDYWEHPDYNDEKWVAEQKAQLGEKGFRQEVLREFQGSGETYFTAKIITSLTEQTRNNFPSRKLYSKWANQTGRVAQLESDQNRGAMWVWKEPVDGHEYILAADCAEGQGDNNDSSVFQIIDTATLEQVVEFYSNTVIPHEFAQVINEVATYYNNALVVVENMGPGGAVLSSLQHTLYYDNLHYENTKSVNSKPGIKMSSTTRPLYLESLQNRLTNETVRINSSRFVCELQTFEYNKVTRKAQAQKGKHDDSIMAMCIGLYTRDTLLRDLPMGAERPKEAMQIVKSQVYEEIKRELLEGSPEDLLSEDDVDLLAPEKDNYTSGFTYIPERKSDRLLREFGWAINWIIFGWSLYNGL
jgi:hypothetical protein